jgi:hypothetical protein
MTMALLRINTSTSNRGNLMSGYDKYADIFMGSMAGQMSGLTREQFIQTCKTKFPVEADFIKMAESLTVRAEQHIAQAQASLKPGQVLGVASPIGKRQHGPLH